MLNTHRQEMFSPDAINVNRLNRVRLDLTTLHPPKHHSKPRKLLLPTVDLTRDPQRKFYNPVKISKKCSDLYKTIYAPLPVTPKVEEVSQMGNTNILRKEVVRKFLYGGREDI